MTPHIVNIYDDQGENLIAQISPCGKLARLIGKPMGRKEIIVNLPCYVSVVEVNGKPVHFERLWKKPNSLFTHYLFDDLEHPEWAEARSAIYNTEFANEHYGGIVSEFFIEFGTFRAEISCYFTEISCKIPVNSVIFPEISGIPPQKEGVLYITSTQVAMVASAMGRTDVISPNTGNADVRMGGKLIGTTGFQEIITG
jgi:hypothetical protein